MPNKTKMIDVSINVLYEMLLWIAALIYVPKLLYNLLLGKKYRKSFLARMGIGFPFVQSGQSDQSAKSGPLIWIHAVSLGETKAILPLARELKKQYPEARFLISSLTKTGHEEAKRSFSFADYHVFMPFDFSFLVSRIIRKVSPDLVILCESDFWFNFLRSAKKQGASIALVNGKISEKSLVRFKKIPFFSKRLFGLFDVICLQNELYRNRFRELSVPEEKLIVTGNLKLDEEYPELSDDEANRWRVRFGIDRDDVVLTIGSTHDPEEKIFIDVLKKIGETDSKLKVILVPRHPERFKEVENLLEKEKVPYVKYSEIESRTGNEKVILIDAMGMLRICYRIGDIALVAGSFTEKVGGHNILEPCWFGKPVLFGPYMKSQVEMVALIGQYKAGLQVKEDELQKYLENWIQDPEERRSVGERGFRLIQDSKGSTVKTIESLKSILNGLWSRIKKIKNK